ncbi:MAG TPA: prohead protease [Desulfofustis sp.]|jgi:tRNA nucleotidyltransferase (CCA-adding enzyme)|nr:CBS domain-containing protein [Desulfofustis sp. PB-SRB1]HBH27261.1 prohead protease [Desulfofustis sp.]
MRIIATHINADFDGLAAMIAAGKLYEDAALVFPGSQERSVREFISHDLLYRYEFLKPAQLDMAAVDTLVIVDTQSKKRLGPLAACLNNPGITVHIFDHHPISEGGLTADQSWIRDVGATTTLVVEQILAANLPISSDEATIFALGIYQDTGSLTHNTTTADDLRVAAGLVECGAKLEVVSQFISHDLTSPQVSWLGELMKSAEQVTIEDVAVVVATLSLPHYVDDFALIVNRFMVMENMDTIFAIVAMAGKTYLIARSRIPDVNVGAIARELGGGGHASAAAATFSQITTVQVREMLMASLHRHIRPPAIAREMMSAPAITITEAATVYHAETLLTRYSINAIPVIPAQDADGRMPVVSGIISRQMVERAIKHDLGSLPVQDFMATDVEVLSLNATRADIQDIIIEHRQRLIPIIHDREVKGIITRTDLLNHLVNDPANLPRDLLHEADFPSFERNRNLLHLLNAHISLDIIELLQKVGAVADETGAHCYVVGGFVRDLLLKKATIDLDIVLEGDGITFARQLAERLGGRVREHERFGTATVILNDEMKLDVATARLEYYEYPAALPTVELSSIKLDLYRRDFTINAMAMQLNPAHFGLLIDFFNSQNDLKQRAIKVLHNLSFVDDPTRIFRAIRFQQRMGFVIAKHTERLIRNAVKMNLFGKDDDPRFFSELKILLDEEHATGALEQLAEFGLFFFLWPDLKPHLKLDRRFRHILRQTQQALTWFKLLYLEDQYEQWAVYLLAVMSRSPDRVLAGFCKRFRLPPKTMAMLLEEKQKGERIAHVFARHPHLSPSKIYELLKDLRIEGLLYVMAIARKQEIKKAVSLFVTSLRYESPLLSGSDLIRMGFAPGPEFKQMLDSLLAARLDGVTSSLDDERTFIEHHFTVPHSR